MRKKQLMTYGVLAGVGYLIYKHMQTTAAPVVVVPPAAAAGVSGFGRFGYYPDGSDRPFQAGPRRGMAWRGRET